MMLLVPLPLKLLTLNLLALTLLTFSMYHLFLPLSFDQFPLSRIALALLVDRLR
jgi:hypothetical protein